MDTIKRKGLKLARSPSVLGSVKVNKKRFL